MVGPLVGPPPTDAMPFGQGIGMYLAKIRIVRYVLRNGKRVRRGTRAAVKKVEYSRKFYAIFQRKGRRIKVPLSANRKEAASMMRELQRNLWRVRLGIDDPFAAHYSTSIDIHVSDYVADVASRGRSPRHLKGIKRHLGKVIKQQRILLLSDLTLVAIDSFLQSLAKKGRSARTRNSYRQAVVGFANWLTKKGRLPSNPLLNATVAEGRKVRIRRALAVEELRSLVRLTEERQPERALLYRIAIGTGLRRAEIKALRVCHLKLDGDTPSVHLPSDYTKNRQDAMVPLVLWLAEAVRRFVANKKPTDAVVKVPLHINRCFRSDLKKAGIAYVDDSGRIADFHSLRKCCSTLLTMQGVHPRIVQQILRHSTIDLTMNTYTDASLLPLSDAVAKIPRL